MVEDAVAVVSDISVVVGPGVVVRAVDVGCFVFKWPKVGKGPFGSTLQPSEVCSGQGWSEDEEDSPALNSDKATPVGDRVAQRDLRFVKSGITGVGVP